MNKIFIRHAYREDIPRLLEIFTHARQFMERTGNPRQWTNNYPDEKLIQDDINSGDCHVIIRDNRIVGTFVLRGGNDPTYDRIYHGSWMNEEPYATIHRISGSGEVKGIMHIAMQFALQHYRNIRIDTHRDNIIMQKAILKEGFRYCGIIHCWNGSERLVYQYTAPAISR